MPVDILKIIAKLLPAVEEQVIDVPKISRTSPRSAWSSRSLRSLWNSWWKCRCGIRFFWHMAVMTLAFVGPGSTAMGRFTGGCRALATSAQGGIQILGSGATVDVPVHMHDKFQQSLPIDSEVPQFYFFDRVLDSPVMLQRQVRTVLTAQKTGDSTGAVLLEVVDMPADVSTTGASRQACAMLGSTVDTSSATILGLLAEFHIFYVKVAIRS